MIICAHASASSCARWSFSIHRGGRPVGRFILCWHPMGTERRSVTWRERGRFREDYNGNTNVGCHISKYSWSKRRICPRSTQGLRVVRRLVQGCSQRLAASQFHSGYGKGASLSEGRRARVFVHRRPNNCKCKNLRPPQHYPRMGVSPRPGHGRDHRGALGRGLLAECGHADEVRGATGPQCGHWRSSGRIQRSFLAC